MNTSQLYTILWLRWRLICNQWSRGGQLSLIILTLGAVLGLAMGAGCGIGGVLIGAFVLSKATPAVILLVWDFIIAVFLMFWTIGIITEIQRSESIDISRLLHLPIYQRDIFLINYLASHFTGSIILFVPAMLGLAAGLMLGKSWKMICLFPLIIAFTFMITAWTYCLRGWLVTLMVNKRRRRAIIAGVTFTLILVSQLPNFFGNVMFNPDRHRSKNFVPSAPSEDQSAAAGKSKDVILPPAVLAAHDYVPFLWVSNGAMSLAQGDVLPAVLGSAGAIFLGAWGLKRAYRTTFRFYHGQTTAKSTSRKPKAQKTAAPQTILLERQLPGVPPEAAALATAFFRSLSRAPEVKMAVATNFIMMLILGVSVFLRHSIAINDKFKPFIASGTIAFIFFGISQLMFNQFGYDRAGFRLLVLLPVQRKYILLGKNLAILPIIAGIGLIFLLLVKIVMHLPFVIVIAAGVQLMTAFLMFSMIGNLISVLVPYRIAPGAMKPTKIPGLTIFLIFITHSLFPVAMIPIFLPPLLGLLLAKMGWLPAAMLNLLLSIVLMTIAAFFYRLSLPGLGSLLQQREKKILEVVTKEVE